MRKAALVLMALLAPSAAFAQGCPAPGGNPRLAAMDPMTRLSFIHETLDRQAVYAQIWSWSWVAAGAGIAWGNFILADRANNDADRIDDILSGSFSLLIPVSIGIANLNVMRDAPVLDALVAGTGGGRAGTCVVLARAEELMARDAADEALQAGWLTHVLSIAGDFLLFGIVAGMGHWSNAWLDLLGGIPISELQIWTQPTGAVSAWKHYRAGTFEAPKPSAWSIVPKGAGVAIVF